MFREFLQHLAQASPVAVVIAVLAAMLFAGFLMTRLTKLAHLPSVTAYILAGVALGPYALDLVPQSFLGGTAFLPDIALAFIAFSTGEFFRADILRRNGAKVVVITVLESLVASALVFAALRWGLRLSLPFSVVLGALAAATAPASTVMTIRQTGAKGDFVETLLQVVALDDLVGLVAYSVAISVAVASRTGEGVNLASLATPMALNIAVLALGGLFGLFLRTLLERRSTDNRLIVALAMLFAFCGICAALRISPLLGCMSMGTVYINTTDDDKLFKQLNYFSPPILLLFFVRSGVSFDLGALVRPAAGIGAVSLAVVGVVYFIVRIAGKYGGAYAGCLWTGKDRKVRDYLGLALIPQAGVAIGLAALGARTLGGDEGRALLSVILASSVLYELVGPACAKLSLHLSGSYTERLEDLVPVPEIGADGKRRAEVDLLIERIRAIRSELARREVDEEEQAFTDAAVEHDREQYRVPQRRRNPMRRTLP